MQCFVFATFCLAVSVAMTFDVIENENGEQYYLVPISREKRQVKWDVSNSGVGASYKANLFDNDRNRFDGTASLGKTFGSRGPLPNQVGGRLDFSNKPSGLSAFGGVENTRGLGTDVNAGLKYNIHQGKNYGVDLTGQYGRHFGGPGGTGPPNTGVFLNAHGTF